MISILVKDLKMKGLILLSAILFVCFDISAQSFTVMNNSKTAVHFQIFASDQNNCNLKYSSVTTAISPTSNVKYKSPSDIQWIVSGKALEGKIRAGTRYSNFNAMYIDASGACVANASNYIGDTKCKSKKDAILNTTKCGGSDDHLAVSWDSQNGNVIVTIN